jgi:enoyl-CoA hydratase
MTALLIKESVNQSVDNMGFQNALAACFTIHQLNHSHWAEVHENGMPAGLPEDGITSWREAAPIVLATKTEARADA